MPIFISMKRLLFTLIMLILCGFIFGQTSISYAGSGSYYMVERSDLRRYDNGKYTGLVSREVRSMVHPITAPQNIPSAWKNNSWFEGSFYIIEKTLRNSQAAGIGLDNAIPAQFHISPEGELQARIDNGFPTFRSFPSYPTKPVSPGTSWVSEGVRTVDPLNKGIYTKLPMVVQYTFVGSEIYKGQDVYRIKAKWATRYGTLNWDFGGDPDLKLAGGSHTADILVLQDTGAAIVIRDLVDETFEYKTGEKVQFKGTITLFTEFPPKVQRSLLLPALEKIAEVVSSEKDVTELSQKVDNTTMIENNENLLGKTTVDPVDTVDLVDSSIEKTAIAEISPDKNNMLVEDTPAGLRLSVRNIQFLPDSDEFAGNESQRLDAIAEVLRLAPKAVFLIEGHTAAVGKVEGEKALSIARAKRTAQELIKRGIPSDQFICDGFGGERPIAPNTTEEGRAKNRRVEITILE